MSTLGIIHTVFATVALFAGAAVLLLRKGTRWHRTLGHIYLTSMISLNITAFFIYDLFGGFGPFHWMAVASLVTILLGMIPVLTRRPKGSWLAVHAGFISGSYVGLVAGAAAEVTSRIPAGGTGFSGIAAGITTVLVTAAGVALIRRNLPVSISRTPSRFRRNS